MDGYQSIAEIMKALAHPVRLQILEVLAEEPEACVCHLELRLGQRQAYISQQLAKLREVDLVQDRREGLNIFYSLSVTEIRPLLEAAKNLMAAERGHGAEQALEDIAQIEPEECPCPKCEQKLAVSVV